MAVRYHILTTAVLVAVTTAMMNPFQVREARADNPNATPTPGSSVDGLCGSINGLICLNSSFGPCCSTSGFCDFSVTACDTQCDPMYGTCIPNFASQVVPSLPSATPAPDIPDENSHKCLLHFDTPNFCAEINGFDIPSCVRFAAACKSQAQLCTEAVNAELIGNAAVDFGAPDECLHLARVCGHLEDVCYSLKGLNFRWQ